MSDAKNNLIFDVGLHKGQDTLFYLKKGFKVVGFEANPQLVKYCQNKFSDYINSGKLEIIEGAIVNNSEIESVSFYLSQDKDIWGTANEDFVNRNELLGKKYEEITVKTVDFASCLSKYGVPYYLKIDIEGLDKTCLEALYNFRQKPKFVSIEADKVSFEGVFDEISLLWGLGYRQFKAIQQLTISKTIPPSPPKEGLDVEHIFEFGSSGLFGEETYGEWLDVEKILNIYKRILLKHRLFGDDPLLKGTGILRLARILFPPHGLWPGWYDTHAKIPD